MAGGRARRKKTKVINTAFYLSNMLNDMLDADVDVYEPVVFRFYDRKLYRLRKRIIHWRHP